MWYNVSDQTKSHHKGAIFYGHYIISRKQLEKYNKLSNNIPKICLGFLTPNEALEKHIGVM